MQDTILSEENAIKLAKTGWWKGLDARSIVEFQLFENRLCMDFSDYHNALEKALCRPVFTHELGCNLEGLQKEFLGDKAAPTLVDILQLIPEDKRCVVVFNKE